MAGKDPFDDYSLTNKLDKDVIEKIYKYYPKAKFYRHHNLVFLDLGPRGKFSFTESNTRELSKLFSRYIDPDSLMKKIPEKRGDFSPNGLPLLLDQLEDEFKRKDKAIKFKPKEIKVSKKQRVKPKPVKEYKASDTKKVVPLSQLTGQHFSEMTNDFFIDYFTNSKLGLLPVDRAFRFWAKRNKIDNKELEYFFKHKNIEDSISKMYSELLRAKATPFGTSKVVKTKKLTFKGKNKTDIGIKIGQKLLNDGTMHYLYTSSKPSTEQLVKLASNLNEYFGIDGVLKVGTPEGVNTVIIKKKSINVSGFSYDKKLTSQEDLIGKYASSGGLDKSVNVAEAQKSYITTQKKLEPAALDALKRLVQNSIKAMEPKEAKRLLMNTTVKEAKDLLKFVKFEGSSELLNYALLDDVSIYKALPKRTISDILSHASGDSLQSYYKVEEQRRKRVLALAGSLGISDTAVNTDLKRIVDSKRSQSAKAKALSEALAGMEAVMSLTAKEGLKPSNKKLSNQELTKLVANLARGLKGRQELEKLGYFKRTLDNPILNLEGTIKRKVLDSIVTRMVLDAYGGDEARYDRQTLVSLGKLLSTDDLKYFKSRIKHKVFSIYKLKGGTVDERLKAIDALYTIVDKFGGEVDIKHLFETLTGKEAKKKYRAAVDAFKSGTAIAGAIPDTDSYEVVQAKYEQAVDKKDIKTLFKDIEPDIDSLDREARLKFEENFLKDNQGKSIRTSTGIEIVNLNKQLAYFERKFREKSINLKDYGQLKWLYNHFEPTTGEYPPPKEMLNTLWKKYTETMEEAYPGLKTIKSKVKVNITSGLIRRLYQLQKGEFKKLGGEKLGLVKYLNDRFADWSVLLKAYGRDPGTQKFSLIFDRDDKVADVKQTILDRLTLAGVGAKDLYDLKKHYKSTGSVYTTLDEKMLKLLKMDAAGLISLDANELLKNILRVYNGEPQVGAAGKQYFGFKQGDLGTKLLEVAYDPLSGRKKSNAAITKYNKQLAIRHLEKTKQLALVTQKAPRKLTSSEVSLKIQKAEYEMSRFISKVVRSALIHNLTPEGAEIAMFEKGQKANTIAKALEGEKNPAVRKYLEAQLDRLNKPLFEDTVTLATKKGVEQLKQIQKLMNLAIERGQYGTAYAYYTGLDKFTSKLLAGNKGGLFFTTSTLELINDMLGTKFIDDKSFLKQAHLEKIPGGGDKNAVLKIVTREAKKEILTRAEAMANLVGYDYLDPTKSHLIPKIDLLSALADSNRIAAQVLSVGSPGKYAKLIKQRGLTFYKLLKERPDVVKKLNLDWYPAYPLSGTTRIKDFAAVQEAILNIDPIRRAEQHAIDTMGEAKVTRFKSPLVQKSLEEKLFLKASNIPFKPSEVDISKIKFTSLGKIRKDAREALEGVNNFLREISKPKVKPKTKLLESPYSMNYRAFYTLDNLYMPKKALVPMTVGPGDYFPEAKSTVPYKGKSLYEVKRNEKKIFDILRRSKFFKGFNRGGKVPGKGHKDEIPALLTKGEVVIDRKTAERLGLYTQADYERFKKAANQGKISKFAGGGVADFSGLSTEELTSLLNDRSLTQDARDAVAKILRERRSEPTVRSGTNVRDIPRPGGSTPYTRSNPLSSKVAEVNWNNVKFTDPKLDFERINNFAINLTKGSNLSLSSIGLNPKQVKNLVRDNIISGDLGKAMLKQALKEELGSRGFRSSEIKAIQQVGSEYSPLGVNALKKETLTKLAAGGEELASSLKEYRLDEASDIRRAIKKAVKETTKTGGLERLSAFERSIMQVSQAANELSGIFNIEAKEFRNLAKDIKTPEGKRRASATIRRLFENYNFEAVKLNTSSKLAPQLRLLENTLSSLSSILNEDEFLNMSRSRAGIQDLRSQVQRSRAIRENAQSRWSEFIALTKQNASFALSYAVLGGVQQTIEKTIGFLGTFDDSLKNLQAITGETTVGMNTMKKAIKSVSTATKFSAEEIAQAATIMGQAGYSSIDVQKSLGGVVKLATATGSSLEDSTQVLTSTLTVWNKALPDASKYANEFTAAINKSKLDIGSLAQAIQYTGNIAAAANIPIEDVLTMTALLKNAGIKRGSTLGTGQRLLYSDFSAPSRKFVKSLESVGIKLDEFAQAFSNEGVVGALKLMKSRGYGLTAAASGMEMREKAIYIAAINQLDRMDVFRQGLVNNEAAEVANKRQMEALGNRFKNMLNSWQININKGLESLAEPLGDLLEKLTIYEDNTQGLSLASKNITVAERFKPDMSGPGVLNTLAGLSAIGFGANLGVSAYVEYVKTLPQVTNSLQKVTLGLSKALPGIKTVGTALALGGIGASFAQEGSKANAFGDMISSYLAYNLGSKSIVSLAKKLEARNIALLNSQSPHLGLKGGLAALAADWFLSSYRDEGGLKGFLAGAAEGGILGSTLGWPGAIAGAILGGAIGATGKEAPDVGATKVLAAAVTDSKALSSELVTATKAVTELVNSSNFTLRPGVNATAAEKLSKYSLTVDYLQKTNDKLKTLESTLKTYMTNDFTGFNLGSTLANTTLNSNEAVINGNFTVKEFYAEGTNIYSKNVAFTGTAADAAAKSLRSMVAAVEQAKAAPGGLNETLMNRVFEKGFKNLEQGLEKAKSNLDRKLVLESTVTMPVDELMTKSPVVAAQNFDKLKQFVDEAYNTMYVAAKSSKERDRIIQANISHLRRLEAQYRNIGALAESPEAALQIAKLQASRLGGINKYTSSKAYEVTRERYINLTKQSYGIKSVEESIANSLATVRKLNIGVIKQLKNMSKNIAENLSGVILTQGSRTSGFALGHYKDLASALNRLKGSINSTVNAFGNITNFSNETLVDTMGKTIVNKDNIRRALQAPREDKRLTRVDLSKVFDLSKAQRLVKNLDRVLVSLYDAAEKRGQQDFRILTGFGSERDAKRFGDIKLLRLFKQIEVHFKKLGINGMKAFNALRKLGDVGLDTIQNLDYKKILTPEKIQQLDTSKAMALKNIDIQFANIKELQTARFEINQRELEIGAAQSRARLQRQYQFNIESASINFGRRLTDINIRTSRATAQAQLNADRQRLDLKTNYDRALADLQRQMRYAQQRLDKDKSIRIKELEISKDIQKELLELKKQRGYEDIAKAKTRGTEDLNRSMARSIEDLETKIARRQADLTKNYNRRLDDAARQYNRQLDALNRNYERSLEALNRSRQDTIDFFERSLNRPQVVNIDPKALSLLASNLNDVDLALLANKAALEANTSAVQQNIALEKAKESIVKNAYKDAYKKVGGRVYDDTGAVSDEFLNAYNTYMQKNSEQLLNTVLEQALNKAFAGVGFNINEALNNPSYLAQQVSNPTPGWTTSGVVASTGMSNDELAKGIYGLKADQVRITTTTGVLLEAQGTLEGAFYDLATSLMKIDIQVRETGIKFNESIQDLQINYQNTLEDLSINFARGLEDLELAHQRGLEDINLAFARGMEDLNIRLKRAAEDLELAIIRATEDLDIHFNKMVDSLDRTLENANESLNLSLQQQTETLRINYERGLADIAKNLDRSLSDISRQASYAAEDAARAYYRALDDLKRAFERQNQELDIQTQEAKDKLARSMEDSNAILDIQYNQAIEKINLSFQQQTDSLVQNLAVWVKNFSNSLNLSLANANFDTTVMVARLQSQINSGLKGLSIDASEILNGVVNMLKGILNGSQMKIIATQLSDELAKILRGGILALKDPSKKLDVELKKIFDQKLGVTLKNSAVTLNANAVELGNGLQKFDNAIKDIDDVGANLGKAASSIEDGFKKITPAVDQIKSSGDAIGIAAKNLKIGAEDLNSTVPLLASTGGGMSAGAQVISNATDMLGTAANSLGNVGSKLVDSAGFISSEAGKAEQEAAVGMTSLGKQLYDLGVAISDLAQDAVAQIQNAVAAANSASGGKSTGGWIPGYGGGDIKHYMLEPGEYVVRKEVVRQLGVDWFNDLNFKGPAQVMPAQTIGLPINSNSNINISIGVNADRSIETVIQDNIDTIADGVKKVFEEHL